MLATSSIMYARLALILICLLPGGCAAIPAVRHQPQFHNPFPQLHRVAILPFFNLSSEPTVNQDEVAEAYFNELQRIPGFEVMPPGVVKQWLVANRMQIDGSTDFQLLARQLGVDVLIRGAVTEYSPYYPPRMGLSVDWFAANPSFHPIPPGYGLPWGTPQEEYIPEALVMEAELALAREQLATQTPEMPADLPQTGRRGSEQGVRPASGASAKIREGDRKASEGSGDQQRVAEVRTAGGRPLGKDAVDSAEELPAADVPDLPADWPDPRGFVPPAPSPVRPPYCPQPEPVISHTRIYHGDDDQFTGRLEEYFFFRDDARIGGWQGYLSRSHDFIRFCCYLHITEILSARGGTSKTRVVWRWPIGRYDVGTGMK